MLLGCRTYHDYLWAHLKANVTGEIHKRLRISSSETFTGSSLEQIYDQLRKSNDIEIRASSYDTFHEVQKMMSLGKLDALAKELAVWCETPDESRSRFYEHLVRFATHCVIFLDQFYRTEGWEALQSQIASEMDLIISNYIIHYLIPTKQYDFVAFFVSFMSNAEIRTKFYARFLSDLPNDVPEVSQNFLSYLTYEYRKKERNYILTQKTTS